MESSSTTKTIAMTTSDAMLFHVEDPVAMEFGVVKAYFHDEIAYTTSNPIPLRNIDRNQLDKIISYYEGRLELQTRGISAEDAEVKAYDREFVGRHKPSAFMDLIMAANFLEAKGFLDVMTQAMADHIANKSVEYVNEFFGIENDHTPEELKRLREENSWAFEGVDPDIVVLRRC